MDSVFQDIKNISILSVCIFLIYVLIRIIILILDSKKSIYKVCLEKQKDIEESDFPMFIVREETVYKRIQDELVKIKAEEKTLETAKEIPIESISLNFSGILLAPESAFFLTHSFKLSGRVYGNLSTTHLFLSLITSNFLLPSINTSALET